MYMVGRLLAENVLGRLADLAVDTDEALPYNSAWA
jgi:hypothetical protein